MIRTLKPREAKRINFDRVRYNAFPRGGSPTRRGKTKLNTNPQDQATADHGDRFPPGPTNVAASPASRIALSRVGSHFTVNE
ncbi:MAG: hypothetical protein ACK5Q5_13050 [Planctomycetaceae bacterium]